MTKVHSIDIVPPGVDGVMFDTLQEGDWFIYDGNLGIKLRGRGFYPKTNHFGSGVNLSVVPVERITIIVEVEE